MIFSNFKYKFEDQGLEWTFSLGDLAHFFTCYRRVMRHWEEVLPGRVLTVQYEDLVTHPRQSMRRLLKHCGLPWEEQVMHFNLTDRVVHTFSQQQIKQGMYTSSVGGALRRYGETLQDLVKADPKWELELKWAVTGAAPDKYDASLLDRHELKYIKKKDMEQSPF